MSYWGCILLLVLFTHPTAAQEQPTIYPGNRIGPMVLETTASQVTDHWGAGRQRPAKQGNDYRWWEYPERRAWMLVWRGRVVRAGIEGGSYVTPEGFGVGSRGRSIVLDYGPGKKRRAIPWQEKDDERAVDIDYDPHRAPERYFLDYQDRGVSFLIDTAIDTVLAVHIYRPGTDPAGPGPKKKKQK